LRVGAGDQRGARVRESDEDGVAFGEQFNAVGGGPGRAQDPAVLGQQGPVLRTEHLSDPRRSLNVREEERHQPLGQAHPNRHA
jgi:hypothetical protein